MLPAALLTLSLALACLYGSSTDDWSWGPALLAMAGALVAAAVSPAPRRAATRVPAFVWVVVLAAAGYLAVRALVSPVCWLAIPDLLLLGGCGGAFLVTATCGGGRSFVTALASGLGALVLANTAVAVLQLRDPTFALLFDPRVAAPPSGLFPYYGDFANFQAAAGLLLAGMALAGAGRPRWLRVLFGLLAALALASVPLSNSRGGTLALGVGVIVLLVLLALTLRGRKERSGGWLLLAAPVLVVVVAVASVRILDKVQEARQPGTGVEEALGEAGRLQYAQIALECAATHPWLGGGSRSLAWENYRFWDKQAHGYVSADLVFAHNEAVQLLADYGALGFLAVVIVIATVVSLAAARLAGPAGRAADHDPGVLAGALAGLVAMLALAQFHFVFHVGPGPLLFGVLLGLLAHAGASGGRAPARRLPVAAAVGRIAAAALALALAWPAWSATRALRALAGPLPAGYGPLEGAVARAQALDAAAAAWPSPGLLLARGRAWFVAAMMEDDAGLRGERFTRAADACGEAAGLHPYDPQIAVSHAQALSWDGQDARAEAEFGRAATLQGTLEPAFRARYAHARHAYRKGWQLVRDGRFPEAAAAIETGGKLLDEAFAMGVAPGTAAEGRGFRMQLSNVLAGVYLRLGRPDDALAEWQRAAAVPGGRSFFYHVAWEMHRRGEADWMARRPEAALRWFTDARTALLKTAADYPEGVSKEDGAAFLRRLDDRIKFLKGANIQLPPPPAPSQ